ncbi:glutathione S-transferase family protein [Fuscovulum blasticum]|uniref:glutathione S-transferase family protein n=1 Tax=Fuscovulum blasticum TaxID=1075 RepID=UPI000D3E6DE9|nr:glutathione S-transferase [Fuscovulum blasticum]AWD23061.1 hypothetical protein B6K69_16435 [Fuscovulum blasticum]
MLALYTAPDTASTIIRLALAGRGIPLELRPVPRSPLALQGHDWRAVNPTGSFPLLQTPQGPVSETGAILLWLSDFHRLGPGAADAARPAFLKWLFFLSNMANAELRPLVWPQNYAPAESGAGQVTLTAGRFLTALAHVDEALRTTPEMFPLLGPLSAYVLMLGRWAAQYPLNHPRWFHLTAFPDLLAHALAAETLPEARAIAAEEGLGETPFSAPPPAPPLS